MRLPPTWENSCEASSGDYSHDFIQRATEEKKLRRCYKFFRTDQPRDLYKLLHATHPGAHQWRLRILSRPKGQGYDNPFS